MSPLRTAREHRKIRVVIIDDHPLIREGLSALLARDPQIEVCGEAEDVTSGVKLIETLSPDLAIVDISLQEGSGLDLVRRVRNGRSTVRILVSSMHDEGLFAERALRAGAAGYINKHEASGRILTAISEILAGKIYVSDRISSRMLRRGTQTGQPQLTRSNDTAVSELSDRELEIFTMIGEGLATSEIAKKLHRSVKTIETHRQRIKEKLGLETGAELTREALHWSLEQK